MTMTIIFDLMIVCIIVVDILVVVLVVVVVVVVGGGMFSLDDAVADCVVTTTTASMTKIVKITMLSRVANVVVRFLLPSVSLWVFSSLLPPLLLPDIMTIIITVNMIFIID